MDKNIVASFFDDCASSWDDELIRNDRVIDLILNFAGVKEDACVLDVACGTGVLFDDYFKRKIKCLDAIDISSKMVDIARVKYPDVNVICGDAEEYCFNKEYDCILIYNAFPHFINENRLFENLSYYLKTGGRLTVAHGMSRSDILKCHSGKAFHISKELPDAESLAQVMNAFVNVDVVVSDKEKYVVSGVKK